MIYIIACLWLSKKSVKEMVINPHKRIDSESSAINIHWGVMSLLETIIES